MSVGKLAGASVTVGILSKVIKSTKMKGGKKMPKSRVKPYLRKLPHSRKKIRVAGQLRRKPRKKRR